jgi:hypothetical protein
MAKNTPTGVDPNDVEQYIETDLSASDRLGRTNTRQSNSRDAGKRQVTNDERMSRADFVAKFRNEMYSNALPSLPPIEGYHVCWVSTTNVYDTPAHRESIGYSRVKPEDMPGMEHITVAQGNFAGCIGLNEMIAMKVPMDLWNDYMTVSHHEGPYGEEEKLRETVRFVQETAREGGGDVYLGNGTNDLINSRRNRVPTFSE